MAILVAGCANLKQEDSRGGQLKFPETRLPRDAVALEIGVAQLDPGQSEDFETLWSLLDQQKLPLQRRQVLDQNGLRVAVMSTRAPAVFNKLLEPELPDPETLGPVARQLALEGKLQPVSRLLVHQRISNREGQAYPVATSDIQPLLSYIVKDRDVALPGSATNAKGLFEVTTFPNSDGSVRLRVSPKIRRGQHRRRFGVADGSFTLDQGQATTAFDSLEFELELGVGETMLVAPAAAAKSNSLALGGAHLGSPKPGNVLFCVNRPITEVTAVAGDSPNESISGNHVSAGPQRVLLVRLVQTQMDDLFERSEAAEKLATTPAW